MLHFATHFRDKANEPYMRTSVVVQEVQSHTQELQRPNGLKKRREDLTLYKKCQKQKTIHAAKNLVKYNLSMKINSKKNTFLAIAFYQINAVNILRDSSIHSKLYTQIVYNLPHNIIILRTNIPHTDSSHLIPWKWAQMDYSNVVQTLNESAKANFQELPHCTNSAGMIHTGILIHRHMHNGHIMYRNGMFLTNRRLEILHKLRLANAWAGIISNSSAQTAICMPTPLKRTSSITSNSCFTPFLNDSKLFQLASFINLYSIAEHIIHLTQWIIPALCITMHTT